MTDQCAVSRARLAERADPGSAQVRNERQHGSARRRVEVPLAAIESIAALAHADRLAW